MIRLFIEGVGLLGPGLNGWRASEPVLTSTAPHPMLPTVFPESSLLPATERRRTIPSVKLTLAVGLEALAHARRKPGETVTIFASSNADGDALNQICSVLASPEKEISPTRFHHSVHNAPAGYWSIATRSRQPSTNLCAYDQSFGAGLIDAAAQAVTDAPVVTLFAYDLPYPEPLQTIRPIGGPFSTALVLTAGESDHSFARIDIEITKGGKITHLDNPALEILRTTVPSARSLPLLIALADKAPRNVILEYIAGNSLSITVASC